ncbi:MAG: hypothetical protein PVSMB4_00490 [Ktedonobacterales bacterium]
MAGRYLPGALLSIATAALIALPSLPVAAWLLAGGAALVVGIVRPDILCYLLIPAVALGTLVPLRVGSLRGGPSDLLVGALALGWIARLVARGSLSGARGQIASHMRALFPIGARWRRGTRTVGLTAALLVYLAVIVASVLVATNHTLVLKEALKWAEVVVVFAVGADILREPGRRWGLVWTMLAVGVAEALLGYFQWVLAAGDLGQNGSGIRVAGTFDQPNPYAAYLNLSLLIALALALFGRHPRVRWLAAGGAALMAGAQYLAGSRGGWLALLAGAAVIVVVGLGVERIMAVLAAVVAALLGLAWGVGIVPAGLRRLLLGRLHLEGVSLDGPVNDANFSSIERLAHWVAGIRMFLAHPILGVGAGNYASAYPRYAVRNWPDALGHAHNYYINAAAETGVCGLIAFIAVMGAMLLVTWRAARPAADSGGSAPHAPRQTSAAWRARWLGRLARAHLLPGGDLEAPAPSGYHALALGLLGVVVAVAIHSVVDDVFVHGMELQLALCLALALTTSGGVPPLGRRS